MSEYIGYFVIFLNKDEGNLQLALEKFHEGIEGVPVASLSYEERSRRLADIAKLMQFCRQYVKQWRKSNPR